VVDGGQSFTTAVLYDPDAGNFILGTVTGGDIGISTIPCQYLVGASCPAGQPVYTAMATTVTGATNATYAIRGLTDGVTYSAVVAAVDNFGNVGLPSTEVCDYPVVKNRSAAVPAGGGGCALEALGASAGSSLGIGGAVAAALALLRRRRRSG
jgi:hypothetical protein